MTKPKHITELWANNVAEETKMELLEEYLGRMLEYDIHKFEQKLKEFVDED